MVKTENFAYAGAIEFDQFQAMKYFRQITVARLRNTAADIAGNLDDFDEDDFPPDEQEEVEEKIVDHVSAAATIAELEAEIKTLKLLEQMANQVRRSGVDRKWEEVFRLLQNNEKMFGPNRKREKLIIFTEHKNKLNYLANMLNRYEQVCFDKQFCSIQGLVQAELICPCHPLLEATIDLIRERSVDVMKRGAIFIDENDFGTAARILFYIKDTVQDGIILKDGSGRMKAKLDEIKKERRILPMSQVVTGRALIIPKGLLRVLTGSNTPGTFGSGDRKAIECAAMDAVIQIKISLGYQPKDVSTVKCGYDVESYVPESLRSRLSTYALRMVEVKGRAKSAATVTVTANEIRTALNSPEEFILAIVEADRSKTHTIYLKHPFKNAPDLQQPASTMICRS